MSFRPEEMDTASCKGPILFPLTPRYISIATDADRGFILYDAISHNNLHGLTAIQTRRIDLDRLSWKYPADRQGFKTSLCKPFLLPFNSDTVLRRQIVKWRKRHH